MPSVRAIPATAALAVVVLLAACGGDTPPPATSTTRAAIDLEIEIAANADEGAPSKAWVLRCDPNGGTWPTVDAACERLTAELLSPIRIETRDLQQITDQPVRVSGRAFGADVSLSFPAQGSGTRLARLRGLRAALGEDAFDAAQRRSR